MESQVNPTATSISATVAGGLNQRMHQLQEENDELYNLLKSTETGKLKDEVRSLRRAVAKLEGALKGPYKLLDPRFHGFSKSLFFYLRISSGYCISLVSLFPVLVYVRTVA
jgi:hypothetical protein